MKKILNSKNQTGQAMVEMVVLFPILIIFASMITWWGRLTITKQQLLSAARYGTDLIYYTSDTSHPFNEEEVKEDIINYLTDKQTKGRRLNPDKLTIKVKINRPDKVNSFNAMTPINPFTLADEASFVEVYYKFSMPTIFKAFSQFLGSANLPDEITISARSAVLAGTGAKG